MPRERGRRQSRAGYDPAAAAATAAAASSGRGVGGGARSGSRLSSGDADNRIHWRPVSFVEKWTHDDEEHADRKGMEGFGYHVAGFKANFPHLHDKLQFLKDPCIWKSACILNLWLSCLHIAEIAAGESVTGLLSIFLDLVFFLVVFFLWEVTQPNKSNAMVICGFLDRHVTDLHSAVYTDASADMGMALPDASDPSQNNDGSNGDSSGGRNAQHARRNGHVNDADAQRQVDLEVGPGADTYGPLNRLNRLVEGMLKASYFVALALVALDISSVAVSYGEGHMSLLFWGLRAFGVLNGIRAGMMALYLCIMLILFTANLELHHMQTGALLRIFRYTRRPVFRSTINLFALTCVAGKEHEENDARMDDGRGDSFTAKDGETQRSALIEEYNLVVASVKATERVWRGFVLAILTVLFLGFVAGLAVFIIIPTTRFRYALVTLGLLLVLGMILGLLCRANQAHPSLQETVTLAGPTDFEHVGGQHFWAQYSFRNRFGFDLYHVKISYAVVVPVLTAFVVVVGVVFVWAAATN